MRVTIHDVAKSAGVSVSTVSRALSGNGLANPRTEQKILRIAAELGYRPNSLARGLKTRSSKLIGLVLHNLVNASFHVVAEVVQRRFERAGYQVVLCITGDQPEQEARCLRTLIDHCVDGVVIVPTGANAQLLTTLNESGSPVVTVVRSHSDAKFDSVLAADVEGAYAGTNYLLEIGHRRIGFIAGRDNTTSGRERLSGYLRALREWGVPHDPSLTFSGPYDPQTGVAACGSFLDRSDPPTAIFAANHESTLGVLRALSERHIDMPGKISLLCYEDTPWIRWHTPPITVVDNAADAMADLAVDLLMRQMQSLADGERRCETREVRVGAQVRVRESCRELPSAKARVRKDSTAQ
jgi:LacI family transcriptional regulator